jgi:rRNA maturation endonuclease Nob1
MKDLKEKKTRCANEGCGKLAEEGSQFCASCGLEWTLFHRDARGQKRDTRGDRMSR